MEDIHDNNDETDNILGGSGNNFGGANIGGAAGQ